MRRKAILLPFLFTAAVFCQATTPYTWTPVNPALATARADLCGAATGDGTVFFSGGISTDGNALASVESYQSAGGFGPAPDMNNARASHSCTTLRDGRILVAGGTDGYGNPVGTAEVYDPGSQAWYLVADLNEPRWGHTATLLNDGRVLIAGGQDANGPNASLEIFDPSTLEITLSSAVLSSARINFATAVLPNGLVAIMGGSNGANSLSSVDIYDAADDTIIAGTPLLAARASLSASTLPDGTILVAAGFDGQQDLNSAEIYDVHTGSTFTTGTLTTARHGHLGIPLAGNGNVLVMAGISQGAVLATCERYNFPQGTFDVVGSLATPRARTSALSAGTGMLVSAGGVSTDGMTPINKSGVLTLPAVVWSLITDNGPQKPNVLNVNGLNFGAGPVTFALSIANRSPQPSQTIVTAPTNGGQAGANATIPAGANSGMWTVTATAPAASGQPALTTSAAQPVVWASFNIVPSCTVCISGLVDITVDVYNSQPDLYDASPAGNEVVTFFDGSRQIGRLTTTVQTSGAGGCDGPISACVGLNTDSAFLETTQAPGTHNFSVTLNGSDGFVGVGSASPVTVSRVPDTVTLAASPDPGIAGQPITLLASVEYNPATLGTAPSGTIQFMDGANVLATAALGSDHLFEVARATQALFASASVTLDAGSHSLTAVYSGDSDYAAGASTPLVMEVHAPAN